MLLLAYVPSEESIKFRASCLDVENGLIDDQQGYEKMSQFRILFRNAKVFGVLFTFFVSTSLWVFIEPILSQYLIQRFNVQDYTIPLFFLVFSLGYLTASFCLFKLSILTGLNSKS